MSLREIGIDFDEMAAEAVRLTRKDISSREGGLRSQRRLDQRRDKDGHVPDHAHITRPAFGRSVSKRKLSAEQVIAIRKEHRTGNVSYSQLARKHYVSVNVIVQLIARKTYQDVR